MQLYMEGTLPSSIQENSLLYIQVIVIVTVADASPWSSGQYPGFVIQKSWVRIPIMPSSTPPDGVEAYR